jgi:hypothetical protein
VFQPVDVWRRRVLRARMLSAVRTTAYSRYCCRSAGATARHDAHCRTPSQIIA